MQKTLKITPQTKMGEIEASVELWGENRQSNGKNMREPCMKASTSPQRISELEEILKSFCLPTHQFKKY